MGLSPAPAFPQHVASDLAPLTFSKIESPPLVIRSIRSSPIKKLPISEKLDKHRRGVSSIGKGASELKKIKLGDSKQEGLKQEEDSKQEEISD